MSTSSIDRQQLLEQKRQRLQELKQKRLLQQQQQQQSSTSLSLSLSPLPTREISPSFIGQPIRKSVDASTQTQSDVSITVDPKDIIEKEVSKYDKAIQTSPPIEQDIHVDTTPDRNVQFNNKQEIHESELNEALTKSIKLVNKLHITNTIILDNGNQELKNGNTTSGIEKWATFDTKQSMVSIDINDNLLAIAFTKNITNDAIIYNINTPNLFPEYYLNSLSQIEILKFDKFNRNRIIGGLKNGGICIWELNDTQISLMPVLSTPLYISLMNTVGKSIALHLSKIVFLKQLLIDGNVCIMSISQEGILNFWSTNLLAEPKMSFKIFNKEKNLDGFQINGGVYLGAEEVVGTGFISDVIVSANDGNLYNAKGDLVHENLCKSMTHCLKKLGNYIITSHSEWNLKLWNKDQVDLFKEIPVPYIVQDIVIRPIKSTLQFVTIGHSNLTNGKQVVDLWDLKKKLYSPIATIIETDDEIIKAAFNESGDKLVIIAKTNIIIYKIDESLKESNSNDFDKGI